jgi:hypothetical protein
MRAAVSCEVEFTLAANGCLKNASVGHNLEILSWSAWRVDYSFPLNKNGGLKRTIKEYLRENFYGGILAGEYVGQEPGAIDKSWSLSYRAYLSMANTIGIDRVLFTADYTYGNMKAALMPHALRRRA